jgi:hypothetical protein
MSSHYLENRLTFGVILGKVVWEWKEFEERR